MPLPTLSGGSMYLKSVEDGREPLDKLTRKECEYLARWKGIEEIEPGMPKPLMMQILKERGLGQFKSVTDRGLGNPRLPNPPYELWVRIVTGEVPKGTTVQNDGPVNEVDSVALLRKQWEADRKKNGTIPPEKLNTFQLRKVLKERGIKWERTDTKAILLEKLNGQQDAA